MTTQPRIRMPRLAKKGEVIQIRTLVSHVMESGQRRDASGKTIPRNIINRFTCTFNGRPVLACRSSRRLPPIPISNFRRGWRRAAPSASPGLPTTDGHQRVRKNYGAVTGDKMPSAYWWTV